MIALEVKNLSKTYPDRARPAVNNISFSLPNGEVLVLVGPSGCGKTTTLRLIAGLERADSGLICLNDRLVASPEHFTPPEKRGVGMVFQDHALFPHLTVFDNVAFGLRGGNPRQIRQQTGEMLALVGLEHLARHHPYALSGGERQRVALARALAPRPVLLLMDEPFSSLDADLRNTVREQVRTILKSMVATVIFVTHDQEEALYMGDRLAVFHDGEIEQIGTPEQIFAASATPFVAEFMGDSDFLADEITPQGLHTVIGILRQDHELPDGAQVQVAVRADDIEFSVHEAGNGAIVERIFLGAFNLYRLRLDNGQVLHAFKSHTEVLPAGARIHARLSPGHPLAIFCEAGPSG